ncbi:hypothetical protein C900_02986 [Fulvivirga imtechensis AK7]|uniref:Uncharacterized protein n=1 Tax=Fulvivirga imtechensis AK7 TaxID=1237149 RepID=L8JVA9_9BACT|nr:contractile injection system tape measure protein [Fulvivirga imtechensis]ELR71182.1 hypothetical protein C900_02986 [Fulvivirga imtechensis AK7]
MPQNHHIDKHRIVISAGNNAAISGINKEIQDSKEEIFDIISRVFDKYFPDDRLIEIDKIRLDLGSLPATGFKQEYQRRLVLLLETELKKISEKPEFQGYVGQQPVRVHGRLELLKRYFLRGYEPSLQNEADFDPNVIVEELLITDTERFANKLAPVWASGNGRKRLQYQLHKDVFSKVNALMTGQGGIDTGPGQSPRFKPGKALLRQYIVEGTWTKDLKAPSVLWLNQFVDRLHRTESKDLFQELFKLMYQTSSRTRMAYALSLESLRKGFYGLPQLRKSLKELEIIEKELKNLQVDTDFLSSPTFKTFWLEYLNEYRNTGGKADAFNRLLTQVPVDQGKYRAVVVRKLGQLTEADQLTKKLKRPDEDRRHPDVKTGTFNSTMDVLIRFLEKGLLPQGLDLNEMMVGLLNTHSVLLARILNTKWHLYPVRFRLAHQLDIDHLVKLIPLLFGDSNYLTWLEEIFDSDAVVMAKDIPEKARKAIYFAFFEAIAGAHEQELNKLQFQELLALSIVQALPELDEEDIIWIREDQSYSYLGKHILKRLRSVEPAEEQRQYDKALLHELITKGTTSRTYKNQFKTAHEWQHFFDSVITSGEIGPGVLMGREVHETFWLEMVPSLDNNHLEKLTLQVATFQRSSIAGVLAELKLLEKELRSEAGPGAFYPLAKDIYVVLLQALTRSRFSMSATQLVSMLYREVFTKLKKDRTTAVYKELVRSLVLQSEHPDFERRHPRISNWLAGAVKMEVFEPALPKIKKKGAAGIEVAYQEKYNTADLLLFYIEKEVLPDWASLKSTSEINALADQAILHFDPQLMSRIGSGKLDIVAIQRLISLLKTDSWHQLLAYFEPARHIMLSQTISELVNWAQRHSFVSSSQEMEIFLRTQMLVLSLAPPSGIHEYDIRQLLRMVALKYEQAYPELLALLWSDSAMLKSKLLKDVVKKEYSFHVQQKGVSWSESGVEASARGKYTSVDAILQYLLQRKIPKWSAVNNEKDIGALIREGIKADPQEIKKIIHRVSHQPEAITAFARLLKIADLERVLHLGYMEAFARVEPVLYDLIEFQKQTNFFRTSQSDLKHSLLTLMLQVLSKWGTYQSEITLFAEFVDALAKQHTAAGKSSLYHELATWYGMLKSESLKTLIKQSMIGAGDDEEWGIGGILKEYRGQFQTFDLIVYHLKTRSFPDWASIKNKRSLQSLLNKAVTAQEMADILTSVVDDDIAIAAFIDLVSEKMLATTLEVLDNHHFRAYRQIIDDLLTIKIEGKLPVEKQELKQHLSLLLVTELSRPHPHKSSEEFALFLINQLARKISIESFELYNLLEKDLKNFRSRPLQKAVQDMRLREAYVGPDEQEESSVMADIDTLLYIISHGAIPWWHVRRTKKNASVKAETERLYKLLLHEHMTELMEVIRKSGKELYYLTAIFKNTSVNEFHRIINTVAPGMSGFVMLYTRSLESLSRKHRRLSYAEGTNIYLYIYQYTRDRSSGFTASVFVTEISRHIAGAVKLDRHEFLSDLTGATESLLLKGEHKFKPLLDIFHAIRHSSPPTEKDEVLDVLHKEEGGEEMAEDFGGTLRHYLEYGSLPFKTELKNYKDLVKAFDQEADSNPAEIKSVLLSVLARPMATERILRHGNQLLLKMAALLYGVREQEIEEWLFGIADFMHSTYPQVRRAAFGALAMQVLLKSISTHRSVKFDPAALTRLYFDRASKGHVPGLKENLAGVFQVYKPAAGVSTVFLRMLEKTIQEEAKYTKKPKKETPVEEKQEPLDESLLIHNAGAVILANFLPRYFDMLEMTEKRAFKDMETAARAVHLVQYLVTGQTETAEHELVLNKVLCGLELAYPVERSIELTPREKEVSESLLKGVLQNWDKLKSASIEALREGFLVRDGHLSETPHNWELKVETSGRDILLDFLPWSFNTIKLSWMEKSLNVHWRK